MQLKKMVLCLTLLTTLNGFSQSDTTITLTKGTAQLIVADLIELDYLREKAPLDSIKIAIFAEQLDLKDSILSKHSMALDNQQQIISEFVEREKLYKQQQSQYKRRIRNVSMQRNLVGITSVAIIILLLI